MTKCWWCRTPPPCAHCESAADGGDLDDLAELVDAHRPVFPSALDQMRTKWVRWFHAPADDTREWCNCGRPYPCRTRLDVLLD